MNRLHIQKLSSIFFATAILQVVTLPVEAETVEDQIQFLQQQIDELRSQLKNEHIKFILTFRL